MAQLPCPPTGHLPLMQSAEQVEAGTPDGPRRAAVRVADALLALGAVVTAAALVLTLDGLGRDSASAAVPAAAPVVMGPPVPAAPPFVGPVVPAGLRVMGPSVPVVAPVADPQSLSIPSLQLTAPVVPAGADPSGAMAIPDRFDVAAWYAPGPAPGERGAAILAGHVDSYRGPAVFSRLRELAAGDEVVVRRADGSSARFVVDRTEQYRKSRFPTARVFGDVRRPELRLITCAGRFDRRTGHYTDNLVVFAHLVDDSST